MMSPIESVGQANQQGSAYSPHIKNRLLIRLRSILNFVDFVLFRASSSEPSLKPAGPQPTAPHSEFLYLYHGPHFLLRRVIKPLWGIWAFFLALLFLLPLAANLVNGTAISAHDLHTTAPIPIIGDFLRFLYSIFPQGSNIETSFLGDWGLFLIAAVIWPVHSVLMYMVLEKIPEALHSFTRSGIIRIDEEKLQSVVRVHNRLINHRFLDLALVVSSVVYVIDIFIWHDSPTWWGHPANGWLPVVIYVWISFIIIYQIQMYAAVGLLCARLAIRVVTWKDDTLRARIYDPDGANGLARVGTLINLIWLCIILELAFYFLLLFTAFVPADILVTATVVINYGLIVPVVAILPVRLFHVKMRAHKQQLLRRSSAMASYWHQQAVLSARDLSKSIEPRISENLRFWSETHAQVQKMREYPLRLPVVGLSLLVFYGLQVVVYFVQLWQVVFGQLAPP